MLLEALGFALGVLLLIVLLWLRGLAAAVVPRLRLRVAPVEAAPAAYADLFERADAELRALGFEAPFWMLSTPDPADAVSQRLARVYRHRDAAMVATVMPPLEITQPNRPLLALASSLADGRSLASYAYSAGSAFLSSQRHRKRNTAARDAAALWAAHQAWRLEFSAADAPPQPGDDAMVALAEQRYAELLDDLVRERMLRADGRGQLRLRLPAMLRLLWQLLRAPKPPRDTTPVPAAREAALFGYFERIRARTPTAMAQWTLFGASAALFAVLGGAVWDWRFALLLLGALILHEGGHWLAMRAFGYRNLQVVLLPLLGGVTTGIERDAHGGQRALVALAGPLPGIVLGWALLWLVFAQAWLPGAQAWRGELGMAAAVLLALNYLNLLPILPLDGGRFVQTLLPRGWARLEFVLLLMLALAGLALAWWLNSIVLGALVLLPLIGLRTLQRDARLAKSLHAEFAAEGIGGTARDPRIVAAVAAQGAQGGMMRRFLRVQRLRSLIDLVPPRAPARLALIALYLTPFVLPPLLAPAAFASLREQVMQRTATAHVDRYARYRVKAKDLSLTQLLEDIAKASRYGADALGFGVPAQEAEPVAAMAPPSDADFSAAETRLGATLPAEYRELARAPQRGVLGLLEPNAVRSASEAFGDGLAAWADNDTIPVATENEEGHYAEHALPRAAVARMWVLGGESLDMALLYDGRNDPALACCRVLSFDDDAVSAYASLRAYVVERYASMQFYAAFSRQQQRRRDAAFAETAAFTLPQLVQALAQRKENLGKWEDVDAAPRTAADIAAAEQRLGALPAEYREVMALRNGLPAADLLPLEETSALDTAAADTQSLRTLPWQRVDDDGKALERIAPEVALSGRALMIGAMRLPHPQKGLMRIPTIVLIEHDGDWRWLDVQQRRIFSSLRAMLRARYAFVRSIEPCGRCEEDDMQPDA